MANESITLKEALDKFMAQHRHKGKLIQVNLIENWHKIAGNTIGSRTEKLWIKNQVLHIVINSSVLKSELQYHKLKLVEKVNAEIGFNHISDIQIH